MNPLISIIVPVYNAESTIRKCLDSICNQTYKNIEIICVNDGSKDSSGEILMEYAHKDSRVRVINQRNRGVSYSRNYGIDIARGEWITGVDSDDYLDSDTYEYCLPKLRENIAQVVCFGTRRFIDGKEVNFPYGKYPDIGLKAMTFDLLRKTNVCFWNKLFRKDLLKNTKARFPEGIRFEDEAFHYYVLPYISHIAYMPSPKYNYICHSELDSFTKSAKRGGRQIFDTIKALDYIYSYFEEKPLPQNMNKLKLYLFQKFRWQFVSFTQKWASSKMKEEFRKELCNVINKHNLEPMIQNSEQDYLYYSMPDALRLYITRKIKNLELACLEPEYEKKYRKYKFKTWFSFGKEKKKNRNQRRKYKDLLTKVRKAKATITKSI